jgi:phosphate transport system protein
MLTHYEREIELLKRRLTEQLDRVHTNARAVLTLPLAGAGGGLAETYIDDAALDASEVEIEEDCLKIIALHQPVADHLRFLITVIKANYDLERIGDLLESIRKLKVDPYAVDKELGGAPGEPASLFLLVLRAVEEAVDCLRSPDAERARELWRNDQAIDVKAKALVLRIRQRLVDRAATPGLLDALLAVRSAERIADNAANIAKEVLYLSTGEIVRHRKRQVLGLGDKPV